MSYSPSCPGQKPKIFTIIETVARGGGAEQLLVGLIPAIQKKGYDIEVVALFPANDSLSDDLAAQGVRTHSLNLTSKWSIFRNVRLLRQVTRSAAPRTFWGHLYFGNLYACLLALTSLRGRFLLTLHSEGHSQTPPATFRATAYARLESLIMTAAHARVAVSDAVARDYSAFFPHVEIDVVHNGVNASAYPVALTAAERRELRVRHGAGAEDFLVVVPSRAVAKKGHKVLLAALARLKREKNWCPRVAALGQGPLLEALRAESHRLGIADFVRFSAPVPQSELFRIMQASDAVCMPSLREPFGLAAAEAMFLGVPAVLTNTDGLREIVGDSCGALMTQPGDAVSLANALWSLRESPELRRQLALQGQARIRNNFDMSICATKWARVLDQLETDAASRRNAGRPYAIALLERLRDGVASGAAAARQMLGARGQPLPASSREHRSGAPASGFGIRSRS